MEPWLIFGNYYALGMVVSLLTARSALKEKSHHRISTVIIGCAILALVWPFFFGYFFLKGLFGKT